jgi:branched-chain amino acid aminotransferase
MADQTIIDGTLMPLSEASIPVSDLAFLRGCGAFETLRTYGGHPHQVGQHLARLWRTAAVMGLKPAADEATVRAWIHQARDASGCAEVRVNIIYTPGDLTGGVFGHAEPRLVLIIRDLVVPGAEAYETGITAVTWRGERPLAEHKHTGYLVGWPALAKAQAAGAQEAFYLDAKGLVHEGVTSNLHALIGDTVVSPRADCLPGLSRETLRDLVDIEGLKWQERILPLAELHEADEVWITSSVRQVMGVTAVDGTAIGDGSVGPWAKRLQPLFDERVRSEAEREDTP